MNILGYQAEYKGTHVLSMFPTTCKCESPGVSGELSRPLYRGSATSGGGKIKPESCIGFDGPVFKGGNARSEAGQTKVPDEAEESNAPACTEVIICGPLAMIDGVPIAYVDDTPWTTDE